MFSLRLRHLSSLPHGEEQHRWVQRPERQTTIVYAQYLQKLLYILLNYLLPICVKFLLKLDNACLATRVAAAQEAQLALSLLQLHTTVRKLETQNEYPSNRKFKNNSLWCLNKINWALVIWWPFSAGATASGIEGLLEFLQCCRLLLKLRRKYKKLDCPAVLPPVAEATAQISKIRLEMDLHNMYFLE
jgi:hypothetical protein